MLHLKGEGKLFYLKKKLVKTLKNIYIYKLPRARR
jgi:hypothetical protein